MLEQANEYMTDEQKRIRFQTTEMKMNERNRFNYRIENNYPDVDDETLLRDIKLYQFANNQESHEDVLARERMLIAAKAHNVPVYIITNGGTDDQWAALTLMGYRDYISGVYGCGMASRDSNPTNRRNELNKYECIKEIMAKHGLNCYESSPLGYLFDDNEGENSRNKELCPSIQFKKVVKDESIIGQYGDNIFVNRISDNFDNLYGESKGKTDCTCMTVSEINNLTDKIKAGNVKILFFDWDCTFQSHEGQIPYDKIEKLEPKDKPDFLRQINIIKELYQAPVRIRIASAGAPSRRVVESQRAEAGAEAEDLAEIYRQIAEFKKNKQLEELRAEILQLKQGL